MSRASFGKPLKGYSNLNELFSTPLDERIGTIISSGDVDIDNLIITSGIIDGVVIGTNNPGPGVFTTIQSGTPEGQGFSVCFFGDTVGDSACWEPALGRWNIQGELLVRDLADLGNLRVFSNTISSKNVNGNIILDPDGTGRVNIIGAINQQTPQGDIVFNTADGKYFLNVSQDAQVISGINTDISTIDGDVNIRTGLGVQNYNINSISTGAEPIITTTTENPFKTGDIVNISSSNSIPNIDGEHIVSSIISSSQFTITPETPIVSLGDTGSVYRHNDINLTATDNINIPNDVKLIFGDKTQYISGNSLGNIDINTIGDINLSPSLNQNVNIPDTIPLTFGDISNNIVSSADDLILNTGGKFILNGDVLINGETTTVKSTVTVLDDPVITLSGKDPILINDGKDRGIEFTYNDGSGSKIGFFGWDNSDGCFTFLKNATNNSEVFTGDLGCININQIKASSIDLQGGVITGVNTLDVCDISCDGNFTLTSDSSVSISTPGNITTSSQETIINSTNLTVNNVTSTINSDDIILNSENVSITDPIVTIGEGILSGTNYGIEFTNNNGVNFIGFDNVNNVLTFLNGSGVGDVSFGVGTFTSLNVCEINCANDFIINADSISLNSENVSITDPIVTLGGQNDTETITDFGIEFLYNDGGSNLGFFGWDHTNNCFTFLQDAVNTDEIISGTVGDVCFGNGEFTNVNISGTLTVDGETVSGGLGGGAQPKSIEHMSPSGGDISNPEDDTNISFINVTTSGVATGTLGEPSTDGFEKYILVTNLSSGGEYRLFCPTGRLVDPGSGTSASKTIVFSYSGQSVYLIWDDNQKVYIIVGGNACIT